MADDVARSLMGTAVALGSSLDALAALAAFARLEHESLDADPVVRDLLGQITAELLGDGPTPTPAAAAPVIGLVRAFLRQATDLVDQPGRRGGWTVADEELLQGIGRLSMAITDAIATAERRLDGLADGLTGPDARFLDVGTGTGWLAIAMARSHPELRVVGIDIFEPSLALARANVDREQLGDRIELRRQDATALADDDRFDAIWLPLPFLPKAIVGPVIDAARRSLKPGGWLLPGTFAGTGDHLSNLLTDLRTVRSGGYPWTSEEVVAELMDRGFDEACEVPRTWTAPVYLYAGRGT